MLVVERLERVSMTKVTGAVVEAAPVRQIRPGCLSVFALFGDLRSRVQAGCAPDGAYGLISTHR